MLSSFIESVRHPRRNLPPVPPEMSLTRPGDLEGVALLDAIVCETHYATLQTAAVTSAVNALRHPGRLDDPHSISNFVPHQPPILLATRGWLVDAGLDPETLEDVEVFFDELRPARAHLERLFTDASALGFIRAEILNRDAVTESWRLAAKGAIAAVKSLDRALRFSLPERYAESVPVLVSLLNGVVDGMQPCINAAGQPYLPELPQRRRSARKGLFQECSVRHRRRSVRALVRDVSSGGLGLDGLSGVNTHEMVIVDLDSGRRLMGSVAWVKGRLVGVKFGSPLPPNDPLLFG